MVIFCLHPYTQFRDIYNGYKRPKPKFPLLVPHAFISARISDRKNGFEKRSRNQKDAEKEGMKKLAMKFYSGLLHCYQESTNLMTMNYTC